MKNLKKSKTVSCLNILRNRSSNKNLVNNDKKDNIFFRKKITTHNLAKINNKSSNCITPGFFNPFINYKTKEKKINNKKGGLLKIEKTEITISDKKEEVPENKESDNILNNLI